MGPSSRSIAMLMASPEKAMLITPAAMMPAMKTCRKSVSVPCTLPVKIAPKITSRSTGKNSVKTSDCLLRKNDFSSTDDRAALARHRSGSTPRPGARTDSMTLTCSPPAVLGAGR